MNLGRARSLQNEEMNWIQYKDIKIQDTAVIWIKYGGLERMEK